MRPSGKRRRAVFLDRDGVVNQSLIRERQPYSPRRVEELVVLDGVKEAVSLLHKNGFVTVVVTNQPDIARGYLTHEILLELHNFISQKTELTNFYVCYHDDNDDCECRKPKIGLFRKAEQDLNLDLSKSFMVGDRWKDIEAGQQAGCRCFFIDDNYRERRPSPPFHTVTSLLEAAEIIMEGLNDK
jgi:D-glycero-D-manno-heptose 1,7-bisphosphate phosphatase